MDANPNQGICILGGSFPQSNQSIDLHSNQKQPDNFDEILPAKA